LEKYPLGQYVLQINSDIPLKAGLGSSASFSIVLCAGLYHRITGIPLDQKELIE
jgi:mevalonate kinase